jgi:hypothetical protein
MSEEKTVAVVPALFFDAVDSAEALHIMIIAIISSSLLYRHHLFVARCFAVAALAAAAGGWRLGQ